LSWQGILAVVMLVLATAPPRRDGGDGGGTDPVAPVVAVTAKRQRSLRTKASAVRAGCDEPCRSVITALLGK
jgi:hypothetical protein